MLLLVVDTQKGCFDERLYAFETVKNNIKKLITVAREKNVNTSHDRADRCRRHASLGGSK